MPNDTDTDVLAGGGADTSSDVLAGGGADPGADISMQDVSGAASQQTGMASPLGGQQPGQLPPMIGQPPAGGIGPGAQQTPVGAGIHARHGGLLTGLAGVLLDGIAAGIMTPQSGQGFSQAAQRAYQMPMERQQNAALMQSFKTQAELDKAKMAIAHVNQLQAYALANRLTDEQRAGVTDAFMKNVDEWTDQNLVDLQSQTPNREEAAQAVHQLRVQDPDQGDQYWMWPTEHDGEGNVTRWGVYKMDPNKTVGKDTSMRIPWVDDDGNPIMKDIPIKADTKMVDLLPLHNGEAVKGLMGWAGKAEAAKAKAAEKAAEPQVVFMKNGDKQIMEQAQAIEAVQSGKASFHSKADMKQIQSAQLGMNDLQNSINTLAEVNFKNVQGPLAAALIEQDDTIDATAKAGILGDLRAAVPQRLMAKLRSENMAAANQDTRNFIAALPLAYEGLSQLPRLQTMAQVNRSSQTQIEATRGTLPKPGEDDAMTRQRLTMLQRQLLDPVRRGLPHGPGLELDKAWNEQGYERKGFAALPTPGAGGSDRGAGAQKGDTQTYQGFTYTFDGDKWVKGK